MRASSLSAPKQAPSFVKYPPPQGHALNRRRSLLQRTPTANGSSATLKATPPFPANARSHVCKLDCCVAVVAGCPSSSVKPAWGSSFGATPPLLTLLLLARDVGFVTAYVRSFVRTHYTRRRGLAPIPPFSPNQPTTPPPPVLLPDCRQGGGSSRMPLLFNITSPLCSLLPKKPATFAAPMCCPGWLRESTFRPPIPLFFAVRRTP